MRGGAFTVAAVAAWVGSFASATASDGSEHYRVLLEALQRGAFAEVPALAEALADSPFARKAVQWKRLSALLAPGRDADFSAIPAAAAGVAVQHVGAWSVALSEDGGFAAAARPERGDGGFAPLLSVFPDTTTSRFSLWVDGEPRMVAPRAGLAGRGDGLQLVAREGDLEVVVVVSGGAPRVDEADIAERSRVRIEATVTNRGGGAHVVGARLLLDLIEGFDDAPEVRLGRRRVVALTSEWLGDSVPAVVGVGQRALALRGVGGHAPDRALLGPLAPFLAAPFDLPFTPDLPLGPDSALALFSEPMALPPGAARSIVVEFAGGSAAPDGDQPAPIDERAPVRTRAFVEALPASDATRVVLAIENAVNGAVGPCDDLQIGASWTAGLELIAAPDDATRLGDLPLDEMVQRNWIVRPNLASGGAQQFRFDVSSGREGARTTKTIEVGVPVPQQSGLRGRIVDVQGRPVAGADVWLERDGRGIAHVVSDGGGGYGFGGLTAGGWQVRASKVVWGEPAAKERREDVGNLLYDVVLTSATIGNDGREQLPTVTPGGGRDIALAHSLTRYSLYVCVEWDAPRAYLEEVARGMRRAAEFLYTASDGHLTYGRVVVVDAGDGWNQADLWDWACNHIHPNASVSGIRHRYDPVSAPWNTAINFGRHWEGPWDARGHYGTVVHEFGHYGLGLYDEYLGAPQGQNRGLSYPEMCRCIMGYQYSDWKVCWHGNHQAYTNQGMWNGRSCWQQIEEWHEGLRGGFFAPLTTPIERGGVVPPAFECHVGDDVALVIRDHDSGGFDATLQLEGLGSSERAGVVVHIAQGHDGRSLYQGVSYGDGTIGLMGVHVGDRVSAVQDGRRTEFTVRERRERYVLEFDGGRSDTLAPPPLVVVHPERGRGVDAGAAVEVMPWTVPDGAPRIRFRNAAAADGLQELVALPSAPDRFGGGIAESRFNGSRLAFELIVPDTARGDVTLAVDVVRAVVPADREASVASFDGALELRLSAGSAPNAELLAIASSAGPPLYVDAAGNVVAPAAAAHASVGRLHAIELGGASFQSAASSPSAAPVPFAAAVVLLLHAPRGSDVARLHARRLDPLTRRFERLATERGAEPDTLLVPLDAPSVVALFEE
ncbi:MAG: carboxypeptidase regulatory-like domain-containing protein [Planctomycetes bacterium]|nr:carboxypeptidase regulatory-like domain-containing protein [Planctomycetota bacterium]